MKERPLSYFQQNITNVDSTFRLALKQKTEKDLRLISNLTLTYKLKTLF